VKKCVGGFLLFYTVKCTEIVFTSIYSGGFLLVSMANEFVDY